MALKDVLSALRLLILEPARFNDFADRSAALRKALPELSAAEAEDLAKIAAERLAIYTTSIFTGEGELIKKFMPKTFEILRSSWTQVASEPFSCKSLALRISQNCPWRSFETTELLLNCLRFIESHQSFPNELASIARYEAALFRVKRAPDSLSSHLTADECSTLTVEEFLSVRLKPNLGAEWLTLKFDVLNNYEPGDFGFAVCRNPKDSRTHTVAVPAALAQFVASNSEFSVESLADFIVKNSEPKQAFLELSSEVFRLSGLGAWCVASLESAPDAPFYPR